MLQLIKELQDELAQREFQARQAQEKAAMLEVQLAVSQQAKGEMDPDEVSCIDLPRSEADPLKSILSAQAKPRASGRTSRRSKPKRAVWRTRPSWRGRRPPVSTPASTSSSLRNRYAARPPARSGAPTITSARVARALEAERRPSSRPPRLNPAPPLPATFPSGRARARRAVVGSAVARPRGPPPRPGGPRAAPPTGCSAPAGRPGCGGASAGEVHHPARDIPAGPALILQMRSLCTCFDPRHSIIRDLRCLPGCRPASGCPSGPRCFPTRGLR